jgi:hypothetical protein
MHGMLMVRIAIPPQQPKIHHRQPLRKNQHPPIWEHQQLQQHPLLVMMEQTFGNRHSVVNRLLLNLSKMLVRGVTLLKIPLITKTGAKMMIIIVDHPTDL